MKNQHVKFEYADHIYTATVNEINSLVDYYLNETRPCTVTVEQGPLSTEISNRLYAIGKPNTILICA